MIDALKTLFENDVVSSEIKAEIEEAWNAKIHENKMQVTAELREEFAQKYEHDKETMVEAIDSMLTERLQAEIAEFADDRKQLAEAKAKYAVAQRENANLLKGFVAEQLAVEIKDLHNDKKAQAENYAKLEEFIVEALAKEISEFQEDKNDLAETKVRLVREAKKHFAKVKSDFIERGARAVSETVDEALKAEITQLKEDIDVARKNDFGRKIFEAFASEYGTSYLNEKSETAKLLKVIDVKNQQLDEAKQFAKKAKDLAEATATEKQKIVESTQRKDLINDLIQPLAKDQREIMIDLLESVQTNRLKTQFDKYLPAVIDGKTPAKKATLTEGTEVTGNRETTNVSSQQADEVNSNVIDIKRLAGLN
jgi:hypothetical protein|tara:strand:- start:1889 stop:2989 length:1101 start_codon:yes stop_codon:yes gene_type:complete